MKFWIIVINLFFSSCNWFNTQGPALPEETKDVPTIEEKTTRAGGLDPLENQGLVFMDAGQTIAVNAPLDWSETNTLNAKALIQLSNSAKNEYFIIISDSKETFATLPLAEYANLAKRKFVELSSSQASVAGPLSLVIQGNAAVQYEIKVQQERVMTQFLFTFIETDSDFYQLIAWTPANQYEVNQNDLKQVIYSFRLVEE